ncbi:MAG: S8 family serine peptidase [Candidatus Kuenenia sp.]|nr:S8 family serine peptidase [Candidatus Kuenenia hertensis]
MRVLIQMRYTHELSTALTTPRLSTAAVSPIMVPGFSLDENYIPVKLSKRVIRERVRDMEVGRLFTFDARPEVSTYLIRGEVEDDASLSRLVERVQSDPNVAGVFSDPKISAIAVCPQNPVGSHEEVSNLLEVSKLHSRGMDGSNVMVAIVDTGINLDYLRNKGINPGFDAGKSWTPVPGLIPGSMPVDHGTMCAFDVCIAAPNCTLLDYALLQSQEEGGTAMEGFLSDAVKAYSKLLDLLSTEGQPKPALIVNNSWGMFHPSWDFPVGHPGNYSDNPDHPFNIIVESLEDAGADILFAAGNCGSECPDGRCSGVTDRAIYGANSHKDVLCVGGVTVNKVRLGYSSQGPGRLQQDKPDLCAYTHFKGSDVYSADGGTSAACPVAAGIVAAIRSVYSPANLTPAQLRNLLRRTSEDIGLVGFDYSHGFGIISVPGILGALDQREIRQVRIGETVSGNLKETNATAMFKIKTGNALNIVLDGPQGVDFDIYVRRGAEPTIKEYDYRGYTGSADEKIRIQPMEPGEYYVMVRSYRGAGDFSLKATLE